MGCSVYGAFSKIMILIVDNDKRGSVEMLPRRSIFFPLRSTKGSEPTKPILLNVLHI